MKSGHVVKTYTSGGVLNPTAAVLKDCFTKPVTIVDTYLLA
jgi:hypothetical protein